MRQPAEPAWPPRPGFLEMLKPALEERRRQLFDQERVAGRDRVCDPAQALAHVSLQPAPQELGRSGGAERLQPPVRGQVGDEVVQRPRRAGTAEPQASTSVSGRVAMRSAR